MVRYIFVFLFTAFYYQAQAQARVVSPTASVEKTTVIKPELLQLSETEYDFGTIPQGKPVTHIFNIKNTGKEPIILNKVDASCGCTTPKWSREPIPAGGTSFVKVGFNAAAIGSFLKPVFITYNGDQTAQLIIKGEVLKTPVASAPENKIIRKLNNN